MGRRANGFFAGTLLLSAGAFLGAGAALLLAPQTGRKTRKDLGRYAKKAMSGAEGAVEEFADTVTGMVEAVGDTAESILDRGKHVARDTKKELIGAIEGGQKQLGKQKARLEKLIA
jgi:gas vesicle protein